MRCPRAPMRSLGLDLLRHRYFQSDLFDSRVLQPAALSQVLLAIAVRIAALRHGGLPHAAALASKILPWILLILSTWSTSMRSNMLVLNNIRLLRAVLALRRLRRTLLRPHRGWAGSARGPFWATRGAFWAMRGSFRAMWGPCGPVRVPVSASHSGYSIGHHTSSRAIST